MSVKIRIMSSANRPMQRLGYLKLLCSQTARKETSNLEAIGKQLIQKVVTRVRISPPFNDSFKEYVRLRLTDGVYHDLRKTILNKNSNNTPVMLELQDLYLSQPSVISATGKLIEGDWRRYPYWATTLDLIKPGTYSVMTRSMVLLAVTPKEEIAAFDSFTEKCNPINISPEQSAVFLYCLIDNDAEIIYRLFSALLELEESTFDERSAGDMLPSIIRASINSFRNASLPLEDRERLEILQKVAGTIEEWKGKPYTGGTARESFVRARLEPYCDLGIFTKPDKYRFNYSITPILKILMNKWEGLEKTEDFLEIRFFRTLAAMHGLKARKATDEDAKQALMDASHILKSTLGYNPITDVGLLAGTRLLFQKKRILELSDARSLLISWQKEAPDVVRFTVDRMGSLAFVKFLEPSLIANGKKDS